MFNIQKQGGILSSLYFLLLVRNAVKRGDYIPVCMTQNAHTILQNKKKKKRRTTNDTKNVQVQTKNGCQF